MNNATHLRATGRTIGAATNTAAFVRAQLANGVSLETLQRQLKIRPEHMLDMLAAAPEPPLPKPVLAVTPHQLPTAGWGVANAAGPSRQVIELRGGHVAAMKERAAEAREEARANAAIILPIVSEIIGISIDRIVSRSNKSAERYARAMYFGLAALVWREIPLAAWGESVGRSSSAAHDGVFICGRIRRADPEFERKFNIALSRLAP